MQHLHGLATATVLVLAGLLMGAGGANGEGACSPAPRTGCASSQNVELRVARTPERVEWSWAGTPEALLSNATLCLYDAAATEQSEVEAPTAAARSLILALVVDDLELRSDGLTAIAAADVAWYHAFFGGGERLELENLDAVAPDAVISQLQTEDGACLARAVSVVDEHGPPFPTDRADLIDEGAGRRLLDELAAEYAAQQGGRPLSMMRWINAIVATAIQDRVVRTPPDRLDLPAIFGALHISGWYGGVWFARDGFQRPAPEATDADAMRAAMDLYFEAQNGALSLSDEQVFGFLVDIGEDPRGYAVGGTGLDSLVSAYGYNTGYSLNVNEETVDGRVTPPPPGKLVCEGVHPRLVAPNDPPADAPLFGCRYDPAYLASLDDLRPNRDAFVAAFPERAAELKALQDREEARGRTVWNYRLSNVIKVDQDVREALWDIDNAFLEVVHAAGLLNMGAQVKRDAVLGRRAALASSGVLKGWLMSYQFGLGAPEPRVLPRFDLGVTPVQELAIR